MMMTIIAVLLTGWAVLLAIVLGGRVPRGARMPIAATLIVGIAAWALAGQPALSGAPVASRTPAGFGEAIDDPRAGMTERFGPAAQWLGLADGLLRTGRTEMAARAIARGLERYPRNVDLWVGYGNALVAHGNGLMTPAAQMAFDRAAALDPTHPAPAFFTGLALAQSGDTIGARREWQALLDRSPPDAPYRTDLESRLAALPPAAPAR